MENTGHSFHNGCFNYAAYRFNKYFMICIYVNNDNSERNQKKKKEKRRINMR